MKMILKIKNLKKIDGKKYNFDLTRLDISTPKRG